MTFKVKKQNPLLWIFEPLEAHPDFFRKKMFGGEAGYFRGNLVLALFDGEEPWNGALICTSREHHPALLKDFPALISHPILGKWLYVSQTNPAFEETMGRITSRILKGDLRFGVEPKPKKKKKKR